MQTCHKRVLDTTSSYTGHGCGRIELDSRHDHVRCRRYRSKRRHSGHIVDRDHRGGSARPLQIGSSPVGYACLTTRTRGNPRSDSRFVKPNTLSWSSRAESSGPLPATRIPSTSLDHPRIMSIHACNIIQRKRPVQVSKQECDKA